MQNIYNNIDRNENYIRTERWFCSIVQFFPLANTRIVKPSPTEYKARFRGTINEDKMNASKSKTKKTKSSKPALNNKSGKLRQRSLLEIILTC